MLNDHNIQVKCFEDQALRACLRADGIVHMYIKDHTNITLEVQDKLLDVYDELTKIPRGFIFEAGEFVSLSREVQFESQKMKEHTRIRAVAIIVKDLGQRILIDYYLRTAPPQNPYKVVNSMDEAVKWLNSLR